MKFRNKEIVKKVRTYVFDNNEVYSELIYNADSLYDIEGNSKVYKLKLLKSRIKFGTLKIPSKIARELGLETGINIDLKIVHGNNKYTTNIKTHSTTIGVINGLTRAFKQLNICEECDIKVKYNKNNKELRVMICNKLMG